MNLKRVWIGAAAVTVLAGSLAAVGFIGSDDQSDDAPIAATEQESVSGDQGDETTNAVAKDVGVTEYARGGGGGGGHAGGGHAGGGHAGGHAGGSHAGRGGFGHGGRGWGHGGWGHGGWGRGWGHDGWGRGWGWWNHGRRWYW